MTLKIEVTVPQDIIEAQGAGLYLGHALSAIGYKRIAEGTTLYGAEREASDEMSKRACEDEAREAAKERMAEQVQEVVKRKRRTKAEIEADNAAAAKGETGPRTRYFIHPESGSCFTTEDGSRPIGDGLVEEVSSAQYAAYAAQAQPEPEQPNISTGAERIGPANPEDAAQDAADEAAEAEKVKAAAGGKLTHDDVRSALKGYVTAFGMQAAMEDGPKVITLVVGEGKVKVSDIPDDQDVLAKVIAGIEEMTAKNPFKRDAVAK